MTSLWNEDVVRGWIHMNEHTSLSFTIQKAQWFGIGLEPFVQAVFEVFQVVKILLHGPETPPESRSSTVRYWSWNARINQIRREH